MKWLLIGLAILVLIVVVGVNSGFVNIKTNPHVSSWADEGDPEFKKSVEVKKLLNGVLPNETYLLRY